MERVGAAEPTPMIDRHTNTQGSSDACEACNAQEGFEQESPLSVCLRALYIYSTVTAPDGAWVLSQSDGRLL